MEKDFDRWNSQKKGINKEDERLYFREGEVWWAHLGVNVGYEIDGKRSDFSRPVLILKKFNQFSFLALPLTTNERPNPYRLFIVVTSKPSHDVKPSALSDYADVFFWRRGAPGSAESLLEAERDRILHRILDASGLRSAWSTSAGMGGIYTTIHVDRAGPPLQRDGRTTSYLSRSLRQALVTAPRTCTAACRSSWSKVG